MTSILNNIGALGASRQLNATGLGLQRTIQRLTTGKRINQASDDAAGLGISNQLGADIRIAAQGKRNANDGISYLQVADGVLEEVTNLLTRGAELAQQAQTGTISSTNRLALDAEFQNILSTLIDVANSTTFNGTTVFSASALTIALGGFTSAVITVGTISSGTTSVLGLSKTGVQPPAGWVSDGAGGFKPAGITAFMDMGGGEIYGWIDQDGDPNTIDDIGLDNWAQGLPGWTAGSTASRWYAPAGWTWTDTGAWDGGAYASMAAVHFTGWLPPSSGGTGTSLTTAAAAASAASALSAALTSVSNLRATLGAGQQQLSSVSNSLGIEVENFTQAFSQIRDADLSQEVVSLTRFQVLQQTGTSALSQANQNARSILSLIA
jgi:flagellin